MLQINVVVIGPRAHDILEIWLHVNVWLLISVFLNDFIILYTFLNESLL